ncbi:uncharacterized, partial [Tachysurus ichikawai]
RAVFEETKRPRCSQGGEELTLVIGLFSVQEKRGASVHPSAWILIHSAPCYSPSVWARAAFPPSRCDRHP